MSPQCQQIIQIGVTFYFCCLRGQDHSEHMNPDYGVWTA